MHWKGFIQAYFRLSKHESLIQSLFVAIVITGIISVATFLTNGMEAIGILKRIAELAISIFPSLTGLAFAGYTIVIGTISPTIIRKMSKRPVDERSNSLLEDCNAVFSFMLLIAIFTLFLSFLVLIMIECKWETNSPTNANIVNFSTLFLLLYAICVTFRSMLSVIINVFNFGQYIEYDSNKVNAEKDKPTRQLKGISKFFKRIFCQN